MKKIITVSTKILSSPTVYYTDYKKKILEHQMIFEGSCDTEDE